MKNKRFGKKSVAQNMAIAAACFVFIVAALVLVYQYARNLEVRSYPAAEMKGYTSVNSFARHFTYGDKEYIYKNDLTTILFMGIDKTAAATGAADSSSFPSFRSGGQADFLMLFVLDPNEKKITRLMIDRDTMAEITTLGVFGNVSGTRIERLSLSHGFGDGQEQSAELTVDAISRWLMGIDINFYIAMNLDGIPLLNDTVGGITVTLEDDLSQFDAAFVPGATVTLHGEQTAWFVRQRLTIGDGSNEARMKRQRVYLNSLADNIAEKIHADVNWIDRLFDTLQGSMVSNMSRGRMVNEAYKAMDYEAGPMDTLPGVHQVDADGYVEFWPDEQALTEWALNTFAEEALDSVN
ncbi:MAG: LCP family protein [Oscillospiraceae bacterium]|jgi:LCP family protein required for cell wall assembly|nr:LCP family protein [Oscillospiraceae bacterium]